MKHKRYLSVCDFTVLNLIQKILPLLFLWGSAYGLRAGFPDRPFLFNIDFGWGSAVSSEIGCAVTNLNATNDFWNMYSVWNPVTGPTLDLEVDETDGTHHLTTPPVKLEILKGGDGDGNCSSNSMYQHYMFSFPFTNSSSSDDGHMELKITGLPVGRYDFYLISDDGNYSLRVGNSLYGSKTNTDYEICGTILDCNNHGFEGMQYSLFTNVFESGLPVYIYVRPGRRPHWPGGPGFSEIAGIQIATSKPVAPHISLSSPIDGSTFGGQPNIAITADATDDGQVARVDFYEVNTSIPNSPVVLLGSSFTPPYSFVWNNVPAGTYKLAAVATDDEGATTTTASTTISVVPFRQPSVVISSPTSGTKFTALANISINATASGSSISKVDFYQSGTLLGTDTTAPYSFNWNAVPAGVYFLCAKVTDAFGRETTSSSVTVTVQDCTPAPSGVIAWWPGEGNGNDIVGGNNGVVDGVSFSTAEVGTGFSFDGVDDFIRVPQSPGLNVGPGSGFSIEGWIKPNDVVNQQPLVEWNDGFGNLGTHLWVNVSWDGVGGQGCLYANLIDTDGNDHIFASPSGILTAGTLQHIALTYHKSSGTAALYLNGSLAASQNLGSFTPKTDTDLHFGARRELGIYYSGVEDEMSLYNRALSAAEIQQIFNAIGAGKCRPDCSMPSPISWWPGEGNGTDIVSGNNGVVDGVSFSTAEVGTGFSFDGVDDFVRAPQSPSLNVGPGSGFTIEGWIKPNDVVNQQPLVEWNDGFGNLGTHLWVNVSWAGVGGQGCLYANLIDTDWNDHVFASSPGVLTAGTLQHIALTYDKSSGTAALYVNGSQVASQNLGSFTPKTDTDLHFGARRELGIFYSGVEDEMSLYNRALSTAEIQQIFNAGSAGKCRP